MFLHNREELQALRKETAEKLHAQKLRILICAGTGCIAGGLRQLRFQLVEDALFQAGDVALADAQGAGCSHVFPEL